LFCSGLIAGEGIVGILLAIFAVVGLADKIDLSGVLNTGLVGSVVLMLLMVYCVARFAMGKKKE
jgi:hypothetical protein